MTTHILAGDSVIGWQGPCCTQSRNFKPTDLSWDRSEPIRCMVCLSIALRALAESADPRNYPAPAREEEKTT